MFYGFDIDVANEYGVNEAIMIANFQFWINKNKANDKNYYDGHFWTYNSLPAFVELFPFWSIQNIKTILNSLKEKGVIIVSNYNKNKYDRTNWYAFADESKWLKDKKITEKPQILDKLESTGQKVCTNPPIPDSNPDSNTDKEKNNFINNNKIIKKYGEMQNVLLAGDELSKLVEKYGFYLDDAIEMLSAYLDYSGHKYKGKTHYAVFKENGWLWEKVHNNPNCGKREYTKFIKDENEEGGLRKQTAAEYYKEKYGWNL